MSIEAVQEAADQVVSETLPTTPKTPSEGTDLVSEATAALKADGYLDDGDEDGGAAEEAKPEQETAQEDVKESAEAKKADDQDEADEKANDPDGDDAKPKKESGYDRMKRRRDELAAQLDEAKATIEKAASRDDEWNQVLTQFRTESQALAEENQRLRAQLEGYGHAADPRDDEVTQLRRELQAVKAERELEAKRVERQRQQERQRQLDAKRVSYREAVLDAAESAGIEPRELAYEWFGRVEGARLAGRPEPTPAEVAASMTAATKAAEYQAALRQQNTSTQAPRVVRGTSAAPTFPATVDGGVNFLKANGLI